tara:strand:+ start:45 stop:578 length:534 start_codon:yes stop_codon:yes gene_type:complete
MEVLDRQGVPRAQRITARMYQKWCGRSDHHNIFNLERMVVPINIANSHWTIMLIDFRNHQIHYFDSNLKSRMARANGNNYCNLMVDYLIAESKRNERGKGRGFLRQNWLTVIHQATSVPQQGNMYDCGVFICAFAIVLTHLRLDVGNLMSISQEIIPCIRGKLAKYLVENQIPFVSS